MFLHTTRKQSRIGRIAITSERGQVGALFAFVIVAVLVFISGLAVAGRVAVDRAQARTAADAVALAAGDAQAQQELASRWESLGVTVQPAGDTAVAVAGQGTAQAWVDSSPASVSRSPALVAILERASQLLGGEALVPLKWEPRSVVLTPEDGTRFSLIAAEFGMCELPIVSGASAFTMC